MTGLCSSIRWVVQSFTGEHPMPWLCCSIRCGPTAVSTSTCGNCFDVVLFHPLCFSCSLIDLNARLIPD